MRSRFIVKIFTLVAMAPAILLSGQVAAQQPDCGTKLQFFPYIAINGGATTSFSIHNPNSEAISVKVELFQPNGTLLESSPVKVGPNQTENPIFGGPEGSLTEGWAKLSSESPFEVTELLGQFGVLPSCPTKKFRVFGTNNPSIRTEVAIANPSEEPVQVEVRRVSSGQSEMVILEPKAYYRKPLGESNIPEIIEFSASQPIAGVTLLLNATQLVAALPVITFELADGSVVRSLRFDTTSASGAEEAVLQDDVRLRVDSEFLELAKVTKVDERGVLIDGLRAVDARSTRSKVGDLFIGFNSDNLVRSVQGLKGEVSILGEGSISLTPNKDKNAITIFAPPAVRAINGITGSLSILQGENINVSASPDKNAITISAPGTVRAINGITGNLSIVGGPSISVTQDPIDKKITILSNGLRTLNGIGGDVSVVGGGNVVVTQDPATNKLTISSTGGGGFSLPYVGSTNSQEPALQVRNSGSGAVASFTLDNPSNNQANLLLNSAGSGDVLSARTSGTGAAAAFSSTNPARTKPIVSIDGNAGAAAASFLVSSRNPIGTPTVRIEGGPGSALFVQSSGNSSDSAAKFAGNVTVTGLLTVDEELRPKKTVGGPAQFNKVNVDTDVVVQRDVLIGGRLSKASGSFRIDHPLDPANKYLSHSFVESPDMMNIYNGNVRLNQNGEASIELPDWFEALNRDFRYQLTALGTPCPNLHISEEVSNNRFKIAGGTPGARVSWQVTGIRQDAHANAHRIQVEEEKPESERGRHSTP